jgi:hypothetical protein
MGKRFTGLTLSEEERSALKGMLQGKKLKARTWKRIRMLQLLDQGNSVRATARAVGSYPREVSRVGWRYLENGLEVALGDDPRPRPEPLLDSVQEAAIVAMVCGPAPEGQARWSVRLTASEAVRRGITARAGRETIRVLLARQGIKPWPEKNVVRSEH